MRIGICSHAFRWSVGTSDFHPRHPLTLASFLEKSAGAGAEVVQICDNYALAEQSDEELTSVADLARALGMTIEIGMSGASPKNLHRHLKIAHVLKAQLIRIVLSGSAWTPELSEQAEILKRLLDAMPDEMPVLAIENRFRFHPEQLAELIDVVGDPRAGVCLDPLNSISMLVGPQQTVATLADLAVTMHVKDARTVRKNTSFLVSGCRLGDGIVNIPAIMKRVARSGKLRSVHVEAWMDQAQNEEETLALEEERVSHDIEYLRSMV